MDSYYQYPSRPADFWKYHCLDFNEYQGEIAPSTLQLLKNPAWIRHYPLVSKDPLPNLMAGFLKTPLKNLALTSGADEALFHVFLISKLRGQKKSASLFFYPTYDHAVHFLNTLGFQILNTPSETDLIYLSSPNNPTGQEISPLDMAGKIKEHPKSLWIVDLSYVFYSSYPLEDYRDMVLSRDNVVGVLSFAKGFPLSGLRLACVFSQNRQIMEYFQKEYNKKSIGTLARMVGGDCLQNREFYREQQNQIAGNKKSMALMFQAEADSQNIQLKSCATEPGGGNFFCLRGQDRDRDLFLRHLYFRHKIIVRHKPGWDFLRLTSVCDSFFNRLQALLKTSLKVVDQESYGRGKV